jgi:hypothetical protein
LKKRRANGLGVLLRYLPNGGNKDVHLGGANMINMDRIIRFEMCQIVIDGIRTRNISRWAGMTGRPRADLPQHGINADHAIEYSRHE